MRSGSDSPQVEPKNVARLTALIGLELRFWVAICVTALSTFAVRALEVRTDGPTTSWVIFFATLALYNLDGTLDGSRRTERAGRKVHLTVTAVAFAVTLSLASLLPLAARLTTCLGIVLSGLYALPLSGAPRPKRLKRIPGLKAPFIGFAVAIAAIWVPLLSAASGREWIALTRPVPWGLTLALGLLCTINALLFDIPDQAEDVESGVATVVVTRGLRFTRQLVIGVALLAGLILILLPLPLSTRAAPLGLATGLAVSAWGTSESTRKSTIAWGVDGLLLVPLILLELLSRL